MERQVNSRVHGPYFGPVVLDGYKKVGLAAEAICNSELIQGYAWILQSIEEMGPRRKLSSIKVIFGDGIFAGETASFEDSWYRCDLQIVFRYQPSIGGNPWILA